MTFEANTSTLRTDFNVTPYYDDFDPTKNFHRILFRPGYAVQARELTQVQSMLQNQIDSFGKHVFREGSIVLPGAFTLECATSGNPIWYIKVRDVDSANNEVLNLSNFQRQVLTGNTSGVQAYVELVEDGIETSSEPKTLMINYLNVSNANAEIKTFQAGETLFNANVGTLVVVNTDPSGKGSIFSIEDGVFFAKEHFISFPTQKVILSKYDDTPTCKVGFLVNEAIIRASADASLLDPAQESSNYSAPGADRFKLTPELTVVDITDEIGPPDFVTLFTIKDGIIETIFERSQYNILRNELAKRTFDESGDYYVNGLNIRLREHLDEANNGGLYTAAQNGNSALLSVAVEPGLAYVKGFEVGTLTSKFLEIDKSTDFEYVNSQIQSTPMGSYITVKEVVGSPTLDQGLTIQLYDKSMQRITNSVFSGAQTGNNIGSAVMKSFEYNSGTMGTAEGKFDLYLMDIKMNGTNAFSDVKSVYYNDASVADFGGDVVLDASNNAVLTDAALNPLLFYVGSDYVRKVKDSSDTSDDTSFTFLKTQTGLTISVGGTLTVPYSITDEETPYGTVATDLSNSQKREITLSLDASINVALGGTVSNTGKTITSSGTNFNNLNAGDKLEFSGVAGTYVIDFITNASTLNLTSIPASTVSSATPFKAYKTGDIIDLTNKGNTGVERAVTTTPTAINIDLKETYDSTVAATVTSRVTRVSADQANKTLREARYVKINCATAGTTGPFNLGFSDLYKINKIVRKTGSAPTTLTDGTDVTSSFSVDNGQRDTYYDLASITPNITLGGTDYLLVSLDYFYPDFSTGVGYFSVDSYPVNDVSSPAGTINTENIPIYKSPTSGEEYDLRNHLDFRPVKSITAADSTTVGGASTNPAASTTFNYSGSGLRIPAPSSTMTFDYSYYLSRKDVVIVDQNGNFSTIRGVPAVVPITPRTPDNAMALAVINVTPYPSISPYYGGLIGRKDLASWFIKVAPVRFTMKDVGVLKDRIVNLEYYTTLSLLEKNALDFRVLDENGLDRFKNGVFVDTFASHLLGATYNPDYRIVVDPKEKSIRPTYTMESFDYDYVSGTNVVNSNNIITLTYSEVTFANQNHVTTTRNTERTTYRFIGNLTMNPESDFWVDTNQAADAALTFGPTEEEVTELQGGLTTEWDAWRTRITGYVLYRGSNQSGGENSSNYVGTYATRAEAVAAARPIRNSTAVTIETIYVTERTGVENFLTVDEDTQALGNKVVDVGLVNYIRPQTILMLGRGLKPFAKFYAYFDEQNMSDYVTPLTEGEYNNQLSIKNGEIGAILIEASEGDDLRADSLGFVRFILRIPEEKKFYTGTKKVVITDSPTNDANDATTFGIGYFTAQGLIQQKQDTILTTRQVIPQQRDAFEDYNTSQFEGLARIVPSNGCIAYSFIPKAPEGEEGLFITSVDVFAADKHPTLGVWFEIREMNSAGGITRNQVPGSEVWFRSADVPISTNGTDNKLNVKFPAPIFLYNNVQYAFVIHPESANPNYYFWVSRLGETDINTNLPVTARPMKGTFYTTNNNTNWDIVPDVDLTVNFYRASFTTGVTGQAIIGNRGVEKFRVANSSAELTRYGEVMTTGDKLTLGGIFGGTITVGDLIIGANSNANSSVVQINGSVYTMSNTFYSTGENVAVYFANANSKGITATVSAINNGRGQLNKFKSSANVTYLHLTSSNGAFAQNDYIRSTQTNDFATIQAIENFRYSVVDFEPASLRFNKTAISYEMQGYSNTGSAGSYLKINPNENYYFSTEQALFSRSNEIASLSGNKSNKVRVSMSTQSNFMSPVLDLSRTHTIYVDNIINNSANGENGSSGGYLFNKYISKTVTLAQGQDAEDMQVVLTAYRPPNTDVRVWIKILNGEDSDTLSQTNWIELEKADGADTLYSSISDINDFREYKYGFSASYLTGPNGEVQYTNSQGTTFTGYKYFAIKIGLTSSNSALVPRVADLRTIALQI
jgi:hypothetical protein